MVATVESSDTKSQAESEPETDRDERRVQAIRRFFVRLAHEERVGVEALKKLGAALHGESPAP